MPSPRVSIALCTHNGSAYLAQQLDSLLAQDHPALELVAADDASADGTWDILQAYAPRFASSRLMRNSGKLGAVANFEQVFRACVGDWVAPCDQDDLWMPHKLSRLLDHAGDAALVYCDSMLIDAHGESLSRKVSDRYRMISGSDPRVLALQNCISGHASLFRRSLLEQALPVPVGANYDWWIAFVASQQGGIRYVDEALVQFRQHEHNASGFEGQLKRLARPSAAERFEAECRNLESLAAFQGPEQVFFRQLADLWRGRARRRFTLALMGLLYTHRHEVFAMKRSSPSMKWRHAAKYLPGLRGVLESRH